MLYEIVLNGKTHKLVLHQGESGWSCRLDGNELAVDCAQITSDVLSIVLNGKSYEIRRNGDGKIVVGGRSYEMSVADQRSWRGRKGACAAETGPRKLSASMPGKVVRILVAEGDEVQAGQGVVVVEAMKMQNEIRSPKQGRVQKLLVREGINVNAGEVLALVE